MSCRFCGFSRCYGQENFPSVFLALTSPVAHAEGSGAMMRSCSSRPRHRASAIAECMRGVQTAEGRRRFQFCIERFQVVGRLFLQLGHLATFASTLAFSQFSVGAHGQPRGRVPDVVASRLLRPYHFRALIQSFQSVAAPFPGDSGFDRGCGLGGRSASGRRPEAASLASRYDAPRRGGRYGMGQCRTLSVYRKQATRDSA